MNDMTYQQREAEHRVRWLTSQEETMLLRITANKPQHSWSGPLWAFLMNTGLRLSEALNLTQQDVDQALMDGRVTVWASKGGKPRTVPLNAAARAALSDWTWSRENKDAAEYAWRWVRNEMNLEHDKQFVIHCLRHTFASRLVQRGVDIYRVQKLLGHSSPTTTARYAHLRQDDLDDAVALLDKP